MRPIDADALRQKIEKCALDADRASSFSNPDGGAFYDEVLDRLHHKNAPQTLVDGSPLMLMVYLELDHTIRLMQERGERLFRVRRESYRVNQKNASDRLLHAFPAMITAG